MPFYGKGRPTVLREAVKNMEDSKDTEVVDILLEHKAKINCGKDFKDTAFSRILNKGPAWNYMAYAMLECVENVNEDNDSKGRTLLHVAILPKRKDFVNHLLC